MRTNSFTNVLLFIILIIIIGFAVWHYRYSPFLASFLGESAPVSSTSTTTTPPTVNTVMFSCDQNKTITASFASSSVALALSDGRTMTLPQTQSGSGIRYANAGQTFVFWSEGNTAFVEEGNTNVNSPTQTYSGCIVVKPDTTGSLSNIYASSTLAFSIRYPSDFTPDDTYQYTEMGPGTAINGVKFTIPQSMASGTNLAADSYVSVESIPLSQTQLQNNACSASLFLQAEGPGPLQPTTVTDGGTTYSVASTTGAGAGNRYEETVYAIPGTNPCLAVRYFIHYGVIDNYPPGMVQQFSEAAIHSVFDSIRRTLTIGK